MSMRYQSIADDLRHQIKAGIWATDERLPSESALASRYRVSKPTLRSALELLQDEGLVEKRHGSGNFVRQPLQRVTYSGDRHTAGQEPGALPLQISVSTSALEADGDLSVLLGVPEGTPLQRYQYLNFQGPSPHSLTRVHVPCDVAVLDVPASSRSPWGDDVRARLTEAGVQVVSTVERLIARAPSPEETELLRIIGRTPVLAVERTSTDVTGRVVEAALLILPAGRGEAVFTTHTFAEQVEARARGDREAASDSAGWRRPTDQAPPLSGMSPRSVNGHRTTPTAEVSR